MSQKAHIFCAYKMLQLPLIDSEEISALELTALSSKTLDHVLQPMLAAVGLRTINRAHWADLALWVICTWDISWSVHGCVQVNKGWLPPEDLLFTGHPGRNLRPVCIRYCVILEHRILGWHQPQSAPCTSVCGPGRMWLTSAQQSFAYWAVSNNISTFWNGLRKTWLSWFLCKQQCTNWIQFELNVLTEVTNCKRWGKWGNSYCDNAQTQHNKYIHLLIKVPYTSIFITSLDGCIHNLVTQHSARCIHYPVYEKCKILWNYVYTDEKKSIPKTCKDYTEKSIHTNKNMRKNEYNCTFTVDAIAREHLTGFSWCM